MNGFGLTGAGEVVVDGLLYALAFPQQGNVTAQQIPIKGIGMVEVDLLPFLGWHMATVLVIRIQWQQHHLVLVQLLHNFLHDGGLSRACSASNTNN